MDASPLDTCGAGDTLTTVFALALASGATPLEAAQLAGWAATAVVSSAGTSACTPTQLLERAGAGRHAARVLGTAELLAAVREHRSAGRTIVFTNGCFDLLHAGHVHYLEQAAELGDVLVVAVNSDESVRRLKGDDRPLVGQRERATVLAALRSVDLVVVFDDSSPAALLESVRPDVYVKGGDYSREMLPEAAVVDRIGAQLVLVDYLGGRSTTDLIRRSRGAQPAEVSGSADAQR